MTDKPKMLSSATKPVGSGPDEQRHAFGMLCRTQSALCFNQVLTKSRVRCLEVGRSSFSLLGTITGRRLSSANS